MHLGFSAHSKNKRSLTIDVRIRIFLKKIRRLDSVCTMNGCIYIFEFSIISILFKSLILVGILLSILLLYVLCLRFFFFFFFFFFFTFCKLSFIYVFRIVLAVFDQLFQAMILVETETAH
jgi:hypothetical protein